MNWNLKGLSATIIYSAMITLILPQFVPGQDIKMDLIYLSYFGSSGSEDGSAASVDKSRSLFLSGNTNSQNFPLTQNSYDITFNGGGEDSYGGDVYVSKIRSDGSAPVYSTFVGGRARENHTYFNTIDSAGNIYITGHTESNDFPVTSGVFGTSNQNGGIFVFKLDSTGSNLIWATYLGGSGDETPLGIAVDNDGNVYIAGRTNSPDFPVTPGAFNTTYNGGYISFVTKLNTSGSQLVYSTFLGGNSYGGDYGVYAIGKITVNKNGEVYFVANANRDYTTLPGAYNRTFNGGDWDIYLAKLNVSGSALLCGTYFGGSSNDRPTDLLIDKEENIYVAGNTISSNFPTSQDAYQKNYIGGSLAGYGGDAFTAKFSPACDSLIYCTFIGGNGDENNTSIFMLPSGNLFFALNTYSSSLPTSASAYDKIFNGGSDIYFGKFDSSLHHMDYASYFGGNGSDYGVIMLDNDNNLYVAGGTTSTNLPVTENAYQNNNKGNVDVFYAKFNITTVTGINEKGNILIPQNISLNNNYPNPFNPSTVIRYELNKPAQVKLTIYNLLGQEIRTLQNEFQNVGEYSLVWDAIDDMNNPVSSGVYLYELRTNEMNIQKKMMLVR